MLFSDRIQTKLWSRALVYSGDTCVRMEAVQFTVVHFVFTFTFTVFSWGFYPKRQRFRQLFRHRRRRQPRKATASSPGAVRVRRLAQGSPRHSGARRSQGSKPATCRLSVNLLYFLIHNAAPAHPKPGSYQHGNYLRVLSCILIKPNYPPLLFFCSSAQL